MTDNNKPVKSTGRGGKNNFPAAQIPDTDPGDNTKYLSHALTIRNMPPIDISNPEQVRNRISEYFALCAANDMKPTVTGFRNSLRVANAKALLSQNSVSIADVAYAVGFDDQFYFSRVFKKKVGASPLKYRK